MKKKMLNLSWKSARMYEICIGTLYSTPDSLTPTLTLTLTLTILSSVLLLGESSFLLHSPQ